MSNFWFEITNRDIISHEDKMVSGLIDSNSCLLMHRFMAHTIFSRNDSTKVMPDELFLIWCMYTNRRVNSVYLVFCTMWSVMQRQKILMSMGLIITGLAMHFVPKKLDLF